MTSVYDDFVTCANCGNEQADKGTGAKCEECGDVVPSQDDNREDDEPDEDELEERRAENRRRRK